MRSAALVLIGCVATAMAAERAASADEQRGGLDGVIDRLGAGFYAGISIATFQGNDVNDTTMFSDTAKASPTFGGLITLALDDRFAIQAEAALATKGASFLDPTGIDGTVNLYYAEFPLLIKFERAFTSVSLRGYTGFAPAVLLEARIEDEFGGLVDPASSLHRLDIGWVIGGGVGVGPLFFDLRYEIGLIPVDDEDDGGEIEAHNSVVSLLGGYAF